MNLKCHIKKNKDNKNIVQIQINGRVGRDYSIPFSMMLCKNLEILILNWMDINIEPIYNIINLNELTIKYSKIENKISLYIGNLINLSFFF